MRYNPFSASISDTGSLVIMSFIIVTIIIDTSLPTISLFSGGISSSSINIVMFIITALIFSFGQYVILGFIRRRSQAIKSPILNIIQKFVFVIQFLLIAIFFIIILQMILTTSYDILLLKALVWITSISSFILLGLLAQKFVSWFKVN
ncbi:MAG TPA: hypothetical protein VI278_06355, partial [Nitrososphaeraceae archaeon]